MRMNRWGGNCVFYDKGISESEVEPWLTDFIMNEYRKLIDTRGSFILRDDHLFENDFIPIIISGEKPTKRYKISDRERAGKIVSCILHDRGYRSEEEMISVVEEELKKKSSFTENIIGRYFSDGISMIEFDYPDESIPCIKLYYYNFYYKTEREFKAALSNCLAHEYFHYFHHRLIGENFKKSSGLGAKRRNAVIEALADFFCVTYSLYQYKESGNTERQYYDLAKKRYDLWAERFDTVRFEAIWPYAYAYCFFDGCFYGYIFKDDFWDSNNVTDYIINGCRDKFNNVLDDSKINMKEAYYRLR